MNWFSLMLHLIVILLVILWIGKTAKDPSPHISKRLLSGSCCVSGHCICWWCCYIHAVHSMHCRSVWCNFRAPRTNTVDEICWHAVHVGFQSYYFFVVQNHLLSYIFTRHTPGVPAFLNLMNFIVSAVKLCPREYVLSLFVNLLLLKLPPVVFPC